MESFAYTVAGLVSQKTLNVTGTSAVSVSYECGNEGRPVVQKYPDMATGHPSVDTGPWVGFANTPVSSTTYNAAGPMTQLVRPGGTENRTYNELGQLTKHDGLGRTVEYSYNATANDGRITKRQELSGEEVDYQYDALGRLISAATAAAKPGWTGSGTVPQPTFTVDWATNRLGGFGCDANGSVISGLSGLPGTYPYDVKSRMVSNGMETYGYGAGNRRLWRSTGFETAAVYLYGLGGELLEVFLGSVGSPPERQVHTPTQRARFGGRLIEKLGTAMNADRLGSYQETYPYGELQGAVGTPGEKFATCWRDATGLDYAGNRYYSSQMGRFVSADLGPYDPANRQSSNRYTYAANAPTNFNDPNGLLAAAVVFGTPCDPLFMDAFQLSGCILGSSGMGSISPTMEAWQLFDPLTGFIGPWDYANSHGTAFNLSVMRFSGTAVTVTLSQMRVLSSHLQQFVIRLDQSKWKVLSECIDIGVARTLEDEKAAIVQAKERYQILQKAVAAGLLLVPPNGLAAFGAVLIAAGISLKAAEETRDSQVAAAKTPRIRRSAE